MLDTRGTLITGNKNTPNAVTRVLVCLLLAVVACAPPCVHSGNAPVDEIAPIVAPFPMPCMKRPVFPERTFDIRAHGARSEDSVKNTHAIQSTIDAAAKAGGGTVLVPAGIWLTGALHLGDSVNLHLARGAELRFSQDPSDYLPVVFSRHEGIECYKYSAFIYADQKENIAITGEGTLNGQGKPWWGLKESRKDAERLLYEMGMTDVPLEQRVFDGKGGRVLRPAFFQPMRCKNVLVEGVTFTYGAFWTITPTYCENVIVRNVRIITEGEEGYVPNGDGVDPSSCRNVLIENCEFDTGDDCIAIKAGRDRDGLRVGIPSENVVVRNCRGKRGHGGIVVGSETSGSIRNVFAVNCLFIGTDRIVRIKTARGRGGLIESMWFRGLSGESILREAVHVNMLYTGERLPAQPISDATPSVRELHFEHITCVSGASYAVELLGLPERTIERITFDGVLATSQKGINCSDVKTIRFSNINITSASMPLVKIVDGEDIAFDSLTIPVGTTQLLRVEGAKAREIHIRSSAVSQLEQLVSTGPEVPAGAVRIGE